MPQSLTAGHSQQQPVDNPFRAASRNGTGLSSSQFVTPETHQQPHNTEEARHQMASAVTMSEHDMQPLRQLDSDGEWVELESSEADEEDEQVEDCKFFMALELMDGSANIQQMIEKLQAAVRELKQFHDLGYELEGAVENGEAHLVKRVSPPDGFVGSLN